MISLRMMEVITVLKTHGGRLVQVNECWTYPGCPTRQEVIMQRKQDALPPKTWSITKRNPNWIVPLSTIKSLVARGIIELDKSGSYVLVENADEVIRTAQKK